MARRADDEPFPLRLGVFGGTFDPPHNGHRIVARDVAGLLELDQVLWIPAGVPPHKPENGLTDSALRLEMARATIEGEPDFAVSDLELRRRGPSYTVDTVASLAAQYPGAALFLILGVDQYRTFAEWCRPSEILRRATLVVMDRGGEEPRQMVPGVPGAERAVFVSVTRVDVSSTLVRERIARGASVHDLVPAGVEAIIAREGLYRK